MLQRFLNILLDGRIQSCLSDSIHRVGIRTSENKYEFGARQRSVFGPRKNCLHSNDAQIYSDMMPNGSWVDDPDILEACLFDVSARMSKHSSRLNHQKAEFITFKRQLQQQVSDIRQLRLDLYTVHREYATNNLWSSVSWYSQTTEGQGSAISSQKVLKLQRL